MSAENQIKLSRNQYRAIHMRDKKIERLKAQQGWQGTGSASDPIVIDNIVGFKPRLWFHESTYHFVLRGVSVYELIFHNTQNVLVENCIINKLEIEVYQNMTVKNNTIISIKLLYTRNSVIEGNSLTQKVKKTIENNSFEKIQPFLETMQLIVIV
ncbi:MAG: hypothetical protein ACFFAS_02365 [Promethearchaeota archaeon]